MVKSYWCKKCGYKYECYLSENGERACPDCSNDVTSITIETRDRKVDNNNTVEWCIQYTNSTGSDTKVTANDYEDALSKVEDLIPEERCVRKVWPSSKREP